MAVLTLIRSLPSRLLVGVIVVYQRVVSPHMPASCRFAPTCSEYSVQALRRYGLLKGLVLSIHRVFRCHPWGGHGYDPPVWYSDRPDVAEHESQPRSS